jgi:hypothetical protein
MNMQVGHGFASILAMINHKAEALAGGADAKLAGHGTCRQEQGPQLRLIGRNRLTHTGDDVLRHDENVDGSLGRDVPEGEGVSILVDDISWDFAGDDAFEKGHAGRGRLARLGWNLSGGAEFDPAAIAGGHAVAEEGFDFAFELAAGLRPVFRGTEAFHAFMGRSEGDGAGSQFSEFLEPGIQELKEAQFKALSGFPGEVIQG